MSFRIFTELTQKIACTANEKLSPRKLPAKITGISLRVAEKVIRMEEDEQKLPESSATTGRPKKQIYNAIVMVVREIILSWNLSGQPVTANNLCAELLKRGILIHKRTLCRYLKQLGYYYGMGAKTRHPAQFAQQHRVL